MPVWVRVGVRIIVGCNRVGFGWAVRPCAGDVFLTLRQRARRMDWSSGCSAGWEAGSMWPRRVPGAAAAEVGVDDDEVNAVCSNNVSSLRRSVSGSAGSDALAVALLGLAGSIDPSVEPAWGPSSLTPLPS